MKNNQEIENIKATEEDQIQQNSETKDIAKSVEVNDNKVILEKIASLEDQLLRSVAELENTRRRHEKALIDTRDYAITSFAKDLLSVMDNLTRALEHTPLSEQDDQMTSMMTGVKLTRDELALVFKQYGLESIEPLSGEKFNYNLHHAVSQIVTDEYDHGSIANTIQAGYKIKDRLLRPAMVTVIKKANENKED